MTQVKICGVTTIEDAVMVVESGADMIGLNFYKPSPRYLEPMAAKTIVDALRQQFGEASPLIVGVFVNATGSDIDTIIHRVGLDCAQLSGDESDNMLVELRGRAFKAIRPLNQQQALEDAACYSKTPPGDARAPNLLLDAYHPDLYGGTGEQASTDVALAVKAQVSRLMLAGGLNPDNIAERVAAVQPWGVDVASGVESGTPGVKDAAKVQAFISRAKQAQV